MYNNFSENYQTTIGEYVLPHLFISWRLVVRPLLPPSLPRPPPLSPATPPPPPPRELNYAHPWPTGADFALKIIRCEDGNVIRLQLWDIAGQERFGNMTRVYFKGAVGAVVVHDINKKGPNCFDAPRRWKKELDEHVGAGGKTADGKGVPTVLLANKSDLLGDRALPTEALDKLVSEAGFYKWFDTSAKTGHNVDAAITALVEEVMRKQGVTGGSSGEVRWP